MHRLPVLALSLALLAAPAAARQCEGELFPASLDQNAGYGWAVSADGDRAATSAPGGQSVGPGVVHFLQHSGAGWTVAAELSASDAGADDSFGYSVALDGDRVAVGAKDHDGLAANCGAVYVFERSVAGWVQEGPLFAPDAGFGDAFGFSVALRGDVLAVGARNDEPLGPFSGSVYVFTHDASGWQYRAKLIASDGGTDALFGETVALAGGRLFAGAPGDSTNIEDAGAVYVFEPAGGGFAETAKLVASDAARDGSLGMALAADGERVLVSAPHKHSDGTTPGPGAVYLFEFRGGSWLEEDRVAPAGLSPNGFFGSSVALAGDLAVVGAEYAIHPSAGFPTGAVYFLRRTSVGWIPIDRVSPPDPRGDDRLGRDVALAGDVALVGAPGHSHGGHDPGTLYVLELACICGTLGESACFGDGSGAPCPCANESGAGEAEGCANSTGRGARLGAYGTASVAADDLALCAEGLRPGPFNALLAGDALATQPFGDGLRCAGGSVVLLGTQPALGDGTVEYGPGLGALAGWGPGDLRHFQVQYRDPQGGPCATGFNLSPSLTIAFGP